MTDARTIGWTAAQARSQRRIFQRILRFNMTLQVLGGSPNVRAWISCRAHSICTADRPSGWIRAGR
jgi:hypothetical protein